MNPLTSLDRKTLITRIREALPGTQAIFLFGSEVDGSANIDSDLDIAVLGASPFDRLDIWNLAATLASLLERDVDLIDLTRASSVMKFQIVNKGELLWQRDHAGDVFTSSAQREYWDWEIIRRPIIEQIKESGSVYGR